MLAISYTDSDFAFKTIAVGLELMVARQGKLVSNKSDIITPFASLLFDVGAPLKFCNIAEKKDLGSNVGSS